MMTHAVATPHGLLSEPELAGPLVDAGLARSLLAWARHQGLALGVKRAGDGRYLQANQALAEILGCPWSEMPGRSDAELLDPAAAALLRAADHTAIAQSGALVSEHRLELRGELREFQVLRLAMSASTVDVGEVLICSIWQDLAPQRRRDVQLRQALDQLEQQQLLNLKLRRELADQGLGESTRGLYNPARFDDQMRRELDLSSREHREFALVYLAIDAPGEKVSALGAPARDRIGEAMAGLLRGNIRAMDASCRIDEQRFAVLLSGVGLATAHARMEGLRRQCATQIVMLDGEDLRFSVAMGVASYPHTASDPAELMAACSAALDEAGRRGGNCVALARIRFESR